MKSRIFVTVAQICHVTHDVTIVSRDLTGDYTGHLAAGLWEICTFLTFINKVELVSIFFNSNGAKWVIWVIIGQWVM